jgi:hypothetical protein
MPITITKNASTGNILITDTGKPAIRLCNHGATVITNNDASTHIIITTENYDGHLLLSDITTIGNNTGGPFTLANALSHLDDIFKK